MLFPRLDAPYHVYILSSRPQGTLYIGMTNDLLSRLYEHKTKAREGFTKRYDVNQLVWFEARRGLNDAFQRERRLKQWKRQWKINLIETMNPQWEDLAMRPDLPWEDPDVASRYRSLLGSRPTPG